MQYKLTFSTSNKKKHMEFYSFSISCVMFLTMHCLFLVHSNQETDRISLLSFKSQIVSDPENALQNWNSTGVHFCNWSGVKCNNDTNEVVQLVLTGRSLRGNISPALSNLSSLYVLDLAKNFFEGSIPTELGSLFQLKELSLSWNLLQGAIPTEFSSLRRLVYIDLKSNHLAGDIPSQFLCNSSVLEYIDLSNNSFSGEIPMTNECQLKELRFLLLWSNRLVGQVPLALSNSSKLLWIDLESNYFSGDLPSRIISHMPKLQILFLSYNEFVSHDGNTNLEPFFTSLVNSTNLRELELGGNNLGGEIPSIIGDLSKNLVHILLDENLLYGSIPPQISNFVNLTLLNLSSNLLNSTIPPELCKLRKLERVYLSNNSLSGEIPSAIGNIPRLGLLDLSKNKLSGSIPDTFENLSQLRLLKLQENELSGTIPQSLGKCDNLEILDLSHNRISGHVDGDVVAGLKNLKLYLNLSNNYFSGELPFELSKMDMVLGIDLSFNNLSGTIPSQIGNCIALERLNLSNNSLQGSIPAAIGLLPYLQELDLSINRLTGEIPQSLQSSSTLKMVNLSYNMFSGNISDSSAFSGLTLDSFRGNDGLCGSIKGMRACKKKRTKYHIIILPILISLCATPLLCVFAYPLVLKSRYRRKCLMSNERGDDLEEEQERKDSKYPRISYRQLVEATGGFNASRLLGSGRFGHVYEGTLCTGTKIAVKVLDPKTAGEFSNSFKTECEVLKRTRHRNLIKIITTCSRPDFKALVLPLMSNGSLERHLYPNNNDKLSCQLDLIQLVKISSDVAEAVAYLHHDSPVRVVHCDLKPSNILLDNDMTALVTDFGISRLIRTNDDNDSDNDSASYSSTDGLLCGSVGYIAPEYGMGKRASTQGDVYSFGVLLLEIVTRKRPTDINVNEGSALHEYVKSHYPNNLEPIVEQALSTCRPEGMPSSYDNIWHDVILEMIELGLMCTQYTPSTRPSMLIVATEIGRLKHHLSLVPSLILSKEVESVVTAIERVEE